jgi:hypothetical protein
MAVLLLIVAEVEVLFRLVVSVGSVAAAECSFDLIRVGECGIAFDCEESKPNGEDTLQNKLRIADRTDQIEHPRDRDAIPIREKGSGAERRPEETCNRKVAAVVVHFGRGDEADVRREIIWDGIDRELRKRSLVRRTDRTEFPAFVLLLEEAAIKLAFFIQLDFDRIRRRNVGRKNVCNVAS